jgi:hypothetical protein
VRSFVVVAAALLVIAPATASESSSLALDVRINTGFAPVGCPPGTPDTVFCYAATSSTSIRGLGATTWPLKVNADRSDPQQRCSSWTLAAVVGVAGKGEFTISGYSEGCPSFFEGGGKGPFTVTSGTGVFAGASGNGTLDLGNGGASSPLFVVGTLTVAGHEFDLTPPTITVHNKTVTVRKSARAARVRYRVAASDVVDGPMHAYCQPRSGTRFRLGRTRVTCFATDSSANRATARFTVTVKRRR